MRKTYFLVGWHLLDVKKYLSEKLPGIYRRELLCDRVCVAQADFKVNRSLNSLLPTKIITGKLQAMPLHQNFGQSLPVSVHIPQLYKAHGLDRTRTKLIACLHSSTHMWDLWERYSVYCRMKLYIKLLCQFREIFKERALIERDYAAKLQVLSKKALDKKTKLGNGLTVGDDPTKRWDDSPPNKQYV